MFYITSTKVFCKSNKIDDAKRNAGLMTPDDVQRFDNRRYGNHRTRNILDVYRPKNVEGKLPVIISVHGGGWVYGNKEIMQFYCMSLAQHGFAVVNFNDRLAPNHKHPSTLVDTNKVIKWILRHADEYGFDTNNVFGVGDSVGATILGLYCAALTNPSYAKEVGIEPPSGFKFRALGLNCGLYHLVRGVEYLIDNCACEYLPKGGTDEEFLSLSLQEHANALFPPCFVLTSVGDFLGVQAKPFCEKMASLGVNAQYHCYGSKDNPLGHVFHINIKLPEAREANDEECAFFKKQCR